VTAEMRTNAQAWLARSSDVARLIGASFLLSDARLAEPARAVVREFSSSSNARIKMLAQAQGWRFETAGGIPTPLQLQRWQQRIDEMPEELRSGPSYFL